MELTVVQSNDLIDASYNLSIDEMRIISFAASKIDSRDENVGEIKIYAREFCEAFSLNPHNMHRNLINSIKSLATKAVIISIDERKNAVLPWLALGVYDKQSTEGSHVAVEFSKYIAPYLFELKSKFTPVNFEEIAKLNTPFSHRLYQWLIRNKKLHSAKESGTVKVCLDLEWMKKQSGLEGKYERWDVFKAKVINPAVEQINAKTDISVIWKAKKNGRKVDAIQFNYIPEKDESCMKPVRPRLFRRPKVTKGSHEEGVWMRKNLALLLEYEVQLKQYDNKAKLALADLRKIADYASICDKLTEDRVRNEITLRTKK